MEQRIAVSARIEAELAEFLSAGVEGGKQLTEVGRLGTRLAQRPPPAPRADGRGRDHQPGV